MIGQNDKGEAFCLEPSWFTRGTAIVGVPGVGKSHDIGLIARHLGDTGVAAVLLDRTGEHAETLSGLPFCTTYTPGLNLSLSLLAPQPGWSTDETVEGAIDDLSHYVQISFPDGSPLTFSQQKIIGRCLRTLYVNLPEGMTPRVSQLMEAVSNYREKDGYQGLIESRESVVSRLRPLTVGAAKKVFDADDSISFETFFAPGIHLIDLSAFKFEQPKDLVSQVFIKRLYLMAKQKGPADFLRQLLIIDEAHHVAPDKGQYKGFLDATVVENRKYGQGVLVATTSPSQLSRWLLKNISIKVCHLLNDGEDIDLMYRFMGHKIEAENYRSDYMRLETGEAIVQVSTPKHVDLSKVKILG